jgi:galactofuranose transport system permease protein
MLVCPARSHDRLHLWILADLPWHSDGGRSHHQSRFITSGQGNFLGLSVPEIIAADACLAGSMILDYTSAGRTVLASGGNEDATNLMALPATRVKILTHLASGGLAGLAGAILAARFGAGQPIGGVGWELIAIASVVVDGTLLTAGSSPVGATLAAALLLGIIFNFGNCEGWNWLSACRQSLLRRLFLVFGVLLQARPAQRTPCRRTATAGRAAG